MEERTRKPYVITVMAANRIGLLAAFSKALEDLGGNLQEVSQVVMRQYFSLILTADFPADRGVQVIADHIRDRCRPFGLEIIVKDPAEELAPQETPHAESERYVLTVSGRDQPGVLRKVAQRLAQESIDVIDLQGMHESQETFVALLELCVPAGVDVLRIRQELDEYGSPLGLAFTLQHCRILAAMSHPEPLRIGEGTAR